MMQNKISWNCRKLPGSAPEVHRIVVSEALVAIFGFCAKNAAQRWGRELPKRLLSVFPVKIYPKSKKVLQNRVIRGLRYHFRLLCKKCCTTVGSRGAQVLSGPTFGLSA